MGALGDGAGGSCCTPEGDSLGGRKGQAHWISVRVLLCMPKGTPEPCWTGTVLCARVRVCACVCACTVCVFFYYYF